MTLPPLVDRGTGFILCIPKIRDDLRYSITGAGLLHAVTRDAAVTDTIINDPPIIVLNPGNSPKNRKTHTGLNTGSITAIRFADSADIRLIPIPIRIEAIPICTIPSASIAVIALPVISIAGRKNETIRQIPAVIQWARRIDSKGELSFCILRKTK